MPHNGGRNPLRADQRCFVRFRNGREPDYALRSGAWRWEWGRPFPAEFDYDIVGYRAVGEEKPANVAWTPKSGGYA